MGSARCRYTDCYLLVHRKGKPFDLGVLNPVSNNAETIVYSRYATGINSLRRNLLQQSLERFGNRLRTVRLAHILCCVLFPLSGLDHIRQGRGDRSRLVVGHIGDSALDFLFEFPHWGGNDVGTGPKILDDLESKYVARGPADRVWVGANPGGAHQPDQFFSAHQAMEYNPLCIVRHLPQLIRQLTVASDMKFPPWNCG